MARLRRPTLQHLLPWLTRQPPEDSTADLSRSVGGYDVSCTMGTIDKPPSAGESELGPPQSSPLVTSRDGLVVKGPIAGQRCGPDRGAGRGRVSPTASRRLEARSPAGVLDVGAILRSCRRLSRRQTARPTCGRPATELLGFALMWREPGPDPRYRPSPLRQRGRATSGGSVRSGMSIATTKAMWTGTPQGGSAWSGPLLRFGNSSRADNR